jgi:hypothetical protein
MLQEDAKPLVINLTRACLARGVITIPFQRRTEFDIGTFAAVDAHGGLFQLTVHEDATISGLLPLFTNQDLQPNDDLVLSRNADDMFMVIISKKPRLARKAPPPAPRPKPKAAPEAQRKAVTDLLGQESVYGAPQGRVVFPHDEHHVSPSERKTTLAPEVPWVKYTQVPAQVTTTLRQHERERVVEAPGHQEELLPDAFAPEPAWRLVFSRVTARIRTLLNPDKVHHDREDTTEEDSGETR